MMLFEFFKKLFGRADQSSRKRQADDSSSSHEEFVQVKKRRGDIEMGHRLQVFTDSQYSSDEEDDVILTGSIYQGNNAKKLSNNARNDKSKGFCYQKPATATNSLSKCSQHSKGKNSSVERYAENSIPNTSSFSASSKSSTLNETHRLREKKQYGQMLQFFAPDRIQILNRKVNKPQVSKQTPEVVDLEMDKTRKSFQGLNALTRPPLFTARPQWLQGRKSKERTPALESKFVEQDDEDRRKSFTATKTSKDEASAASTSSSSKTADRSFTPQSIVSNSLRDRLSSKDVVKTDYMAKITKRYDARIEERNREAEELKRMASLLAQQNRLAREAALEEQLARSMRLCEAILDEREEPEEAPLPVLSPDMLQEVRNALIPHPPNQVLVEGFGLQITRKDIHTLSGLNWLNDEVINFYMNLLIVRGTGGNFPKVHVMNTFFYPKLLSGGHSSLKRWTRKVDIFSKDLLVVPIHLGMHWCMSIVDFREKSIRYFDSMGGSNPKCLNALRQYLQDESMDKKKRPYDTKDWKLESVRDIPQQMNGSDCGVFSCMFAEYICASKRLTFSQKDMPYFRNKMVYEILKSKLL